MTDKCGRFKVMPMEVYLTARDEHAVDDEELTEKASKYKQCLSLSLSLSLSRSLSVGYVASARLCDQPKFIQSHQEYSRSRLVLI